MGGISVAERDPVAYRDGESLILIYNVHDTPEVRAAGSGLLKAAGSEPCLLVVDVSTATVIYIPRQKIEEWLI